MKKAELAKRLVASELTIGRTEEQVVRLVHQAAERGLLVSAFIRIWCSPPWKRLRGAE